MAEFADASERREAMKDFLQNAPAEEVAAQTPTADDEAETIEEVIAEAPAAKPQPVVEEVEEEEEEEQEPGSGEAEEVEEEEEEEELEPGQEGEEEPEGEPLPPERVELLTNRSEVFEGFLDALDATDYPIPELAGTTAEEIAKGTQELGLRLADAHAMYDIVNGKAGAEAVFGRLLKFQGQATHDRVLNLVLEYAVKQGLIESTDGGAAAGAKKPNASATGDPRDREIADLRAKLAQKDKDTTDRAATEEQTRQAAVRQGIALKAVTEAERYAGEVGLTADDYAQFVMPAMRGMGQDKAILNRIARDNFVDIKKVVDGIAARLVTKQVETRNNKVQSRKIRDQRVPKRVAGEDRTARRSAEQPSRDLSTSEGRRAAAKASLRG